VHRTERVTRRETLAALRAGAKPTRETEKLHVTWRTLALRAGYEQDRKAQRWFG